MYLERIADIAHGNPRLAVMAAEVAKDGPLSSIHDVSSLYDRYFSSIRKDLGSEGADLGNPDLLRAAAIVSFFKAVDATSEEMMRAIEEAFGISPAAFWEAADRLHEMELLDMHEDEVVRVSDQVLGTYLFYLAFFKEGVLDFGTLLAYFFPKLRHRIIDSITPVLNAFGSERIIDAMHPHVERHWKELEEKGDEESFLQFLDVFWYTKRTDTLLWVRDRIDGLEPEPSDVSSITYAEDSNAVPSPSILSLLRPFASVGVDEIRMALKLVSLYLVKRPAEAPALIRILIEDYGFRPTSYLRRFEVQLAVVDELWSHVESGDPHFSRVFLAVASNYLGTHFENFSMKDARVLQIKRFVLPATSDLVALRETNWRRLFALYRQEDLQEDLLGVIRNYSTSSFRETNSDVVRADAEYILPFLNSVLNPGSYLHCAVMHDYLALLDEHDGEVPEGLRDRFRNDTYALAEIILPECGEQRGLDLSYEEYEQYKRDQLKKHTMSYTLDDYSRFFKCCLEIREVPDGRQNEYQLQWGVVKALLLLAERDSDLYERVLKQYLESGDPLRLNGYTLVLKLVEKRGYDGTLRLLCEPEYPTKRRWLFHVHEALPDYDVNEERLSHLYELYGTAKQLDLPNGLDYLIKYLPLDTRVVARVVSKVLDKAEEDSSFAYALTMMFNPHTEVAKQLSELFAEDLDLLKQAYLIVEGTRHHDDYKGQVFNLLLDLDPAFITEYIAWKYENAERGWLSSHDDQRDYSFIWLRPDHQEVMDSVVESVYEPERDRFAFIDPYLKRFFLTRGDDREPEGEERERQDAYLLHLIDERSEDVDFMEYLFGTVVLFPSAGRRRFVERFVQRNSSFEAFRRLPLEPSSWSWSGSRVPVLQGRVNYWESLLPIMNTVDLLPHKQHVERYIQDLNAQIEREKKKDFIGDLVH